MDETSESEFRQLVDWRRIERRARRQHRIDRVLQAFARSQVAWVWSGPIPDPVLVPRREA